MSNINRTELSRLFTIWKQFLTINESQLSAIGYLCQRVSTKTRKELEGRMREEVEKACRYTSQHGLGQASTALSVFSPLPSEVSAYLKPRQSSSSSQSGYSEVATLLCAVYFAIQLRKALCQRRPKDLISVEQTKVLSTKMSWNLTGS